MYEFNSIYSSIWRSTSATTAAKLRIRDSTKSATSVQKTRLKRTFEPCLSLVGGGNGGVTIISARTPTKNGGEQPTASVLSNQQQQQRAYQSSQPTKYSFQTQSNQSQAKQQMPYMNYSQRLDVNSTPRNLNNSGNNNAKDGATDV